MAKGAIPVLVGAGQCVSHWDGTGGAAAAPSVISLAADACKTAFADAGVTADTVEWLAVTRTNEDSIPFPAPFGKK